MFSHYWQHLQTVQIRTNGREDQSTRSSLIDLLEMMGHNMDVITLGSTVEEDILD